MVDWSNIREMVAIYHQCYEKLYNKKTMFGWLILLYSIDIESVWYFDPQTSKYLQRYNFSYLSELFQRRKYSLERRPAKNWLTILVRDMNNHFPMFINEKSHNVSELVIHTIMNDMLQLIYINLQN
jgi:hypothetical protein